MTEEYYKSIAMEDIYKQPERYSWNCLLYYRQFDRAQLLHFKQFLEMPQLVKYQAAATADFLRTHFQTEIDACWEVDWSDVERYTKGRG